MKKVKNLMIVAHPDDELVFGGAELIKYGILYKVVCISYKNNKIRAKEFENVIGKEGETLKHIKHLV